MNTNAHGQQTTDSGHVLKESDKIRQAITTTVYALQADNFPADSPFIALNPNKLIDEITAYVMDYAHTDWSKNVRHGVQLGRKDAVRMLESLQYNTYYTATNKTGVAVQAVPLDELQKIITALTTEATQSGKEETDGNKV